MKTLRSCKEPRYCMCYIFFTICLLNSHVPSLLGLAAIVEIQYQGVLPPTAFEDLLCCNLHCI